MRRNGRNRRDDFTELPTDFTEPPTNFTELPNDGTELPGASTFTLDPAHDDR